MRNLFMLAALLCLFHATAAPAFGQDAACAPAPLLSLLSTAAKRLESMPVAEQRATLRALRRLLAEAEAGCQDLRFSSDGEGMQPVLGPLQLTPGSYTLHVRTGGYFNAALEVEAGLCAYRDRSAGAFSRGQATDGAARILDVGPEGCAFLLAISSANEPWLLYISEIIGDESGDGTSEDEE